MVEYALIFIVFTTIMFGIAGFGHALYAYHFASHEAREAARWAAVNGTTCTNDNSCNGTGGMNSGTASASDITTYVKNHTPAGLNSSNVTVNATWPIGQANEPTTCTGTATPSCPVQVQVQYSLTFIFPLISTGPLKLSSTSQMIIAH